VILPEALTPQRSDFFLTKIIDGAAINARKTVDRYAKEHLSKKLITHHSRNID